MRGGVEIPLKAQTEEVKLICFIFVYIISKKTKKGFGFYFE